MQAAHSIAADMLAAQQKLQHVAQLEHQIFRSNGRPHLFDPLGCQIRAAYATQRAEVWRCIDLLTRLHLAANEAAFGGPEAA